MTGLSWRPDVATILSHVLEDTAALSLDVPAGW